MCFVETVGATHIPWRNADLVILFSKIIKQMILEMSLRYLKNMPFCYPSEKYKRSICSFFEYCYTTIFTYDISCPSQGVWFYAWYKTNLHKIFSALNLTIIFIKSCNNTTYSVYFLNKILFLHFLLNTPPSPCVLKLNGTLLIDWLSNHSWHSFLNASISYNFLAINLKLK